MRISLVSDSTSLQWLIGRILNEAAVTREPSRNVVSNCTSLDLERSGDRADLVLFATDHLMPDSKVMRKLRQICDQCRVWIVYAGPHHIIDTIQLNCSAPVIGLDDFDAVFVKQNLARREPAMVR